jgi:FG-GAP repeat protein
MQANPNSPMLRAVAFGLVLVLIFAAQLSAQAAGGRSETLLQWNGLGRSEHFGSAVDGLEKITGRGRVNLIVGAPDATQNKLAAGAVSVFAGDDGSLIFRWTGESNSCDFGRSVADAGDVDGDRISDIVVGAPRTDPNGITDAGSVYVYSGATAQLLYRWDGNAMYDNFGVSVSGAGDVNQDGYADVITGALYADPGGVDAAGIAYVYSGADGTLLYSWTGSSTTAYFGGAVSGAGDVNGDGYHDVIVGAYGTDPGSIPYAGAAYVYSGLDGSLLYQWSGSAKEIFFGASVSTAGDLNGDGLADVIVGAPRAHPQGRGYAGSVFVYSGADGTRLYRLNGVESGSQFGTVVSEAGDINQDGYNDILIGAPFTRIGSLQAAGSAFIYSGFDGQMLHRWDGKAKDGFFGSAVACAGDLKPDGSTDIIVGVPHSDSGTIFHAGGAIVYSFDSLLFSNAVTLSASAGGIIDFDLNFPASTSYYKYRILISKTGIGPTHYGVDIPLTPDQLVYDSINGIYPVPTYSNLHGFLNLYGRATASMTIPAGWLSALVGNTYYFAAVANQAGQLPEFSSIAVPLTITP